MQGSLLPGRSRNLYYDIPTYLARQAKHGGWLDRKAGSYKAPNVTPERYLQNTNETFHAAIRCRLFCSKAASLGYDDCEAYDPGQLKTWSKPQEQAAGASRRRNRTAGSGNNPLPVHQDPRCMSS